MKEERCARQRGITWKVFTVSVPLLFVFYQFLFLELFYSMFSVLWLAHLQTQHNAHTPYIIIQSDHPLSLTATISSQIAIIHFLITKKKNFFFTKIPSEEVSLAGVSSSNLCCKHNFSRLNYRSKCLKQSKKEKIREKKWKKWKTSKMTSNLPMNAQFNDINEDIISVFDGSTKMKQRNRLSMSVQQNLIFFWWATRPTIFW